MLKFIAAFVIGIALLIAAQAGAGSRPPLQAPPKGKYLPLKTYERYLGKPTSPSPVDIGIGAPCYVFANADGPGAGVTAVFVCKYPKPTPAPQQSGSSNQIPKKS